ncbi:unnamed protein product [Cylindrotheca closterium]|uniref:E3 ubiquitin-protein ligase n=1 Tax=Cylindrotheca closterium TaxID=2856 RepID=A0AAD2FSX3_9STRA|nr:unnamed protein product [Cylindrotheca closterium]
MDPNFNPAPQLPAGFASNSNDASCAMIDGESNQPAMGNSQESKSAYTRTMQLLEHKSSFLSPVAAVVNLRDVVGNPPLDEQEGMGTTLLTPNRGHHALFRALEELEGMEKQEAELLLQSPLTNALTTIVTNDSYPTPRQAVATLEALCKAIPRRVCQHPFKKNDIVWVCRTCQADETCVLCHNCFIQSDHEGHDVAFYHAQAGGCCDCGDPDAWDPRGFCPHHGPKSGQNHGISEALMQRVLGVVPAAVDWMVQQVAQTAKEGYSRAHEQDDDDDDDGKDGEALDTDADTSIVMGDVMFLPTAGIATTTPMDETTPFPHNGGAMPFSPNKAGATKADRTEPKALFAAAPEPLSVTAQTPAPPLTKAEKLGILARQGGGMFLVLKSDDIHSTLNWVDALRELFGTSSLYTDSILHKLVKALRQFGQLVVWGTMEILAEFNTNQVQMWLDGDRVVSGLVGSTMLRKAKILVDHGLFCSILTLDELKAEQRAVGVLQWLMCLARSCDPLCQQVAEAIAPDRHLVPLLIADFKLSSRITKYWHSLLLTLLAVPTFKSHLAAAYCDTYQSVTAEYARGMGVLERSGYALSVQFLNRVTYVVDLVQRRDLLGKLGASLLETLKLATKPPPKLNPNHFVMTHRRYSPCISDLKCVLNVKGMPRLFASKIGSFLRDWIETLSIGQMMDEQVWRDYNQGHVELEVRGWVGAFNGSISLGSLFERLLSWKDDDPSPIDDAESPLCKNLLSCVDLTYHVLEYGIGKWQTVEMYAYKPTRSTVESHDRKPASLPFSTLSEKNGSALAFRALPMSQKTPFSFHLPLQRFVAACLREICLREDAMDDLMLKLSRDMFVNNKDNLFLGLMEFPLLVLSRSAQVRAGLWRRNGNGLNDQVLNYAEPPFCRAMRDADLLLVQFAMLGRARHQSAETRPDSDIGVCFMVHLLLHRLGIFQFCGLRNGAESNVNRYLEEVGKGLYDSEVKEESEGDKPVLPWTYASSRDVSSQLLLLEEFLHAMIVFCVELPAEPPSTKREHTEQAKERLRREVIHRLASGPKMHSELAEVHHVLSHWDNFYLGEEGKQVNPDDATGAALGAVLADVATRKSAKGKMEPDKWVLKKNVWHCYDPSFFHISLRSHQTAAESRPTPNGQNPNYGISPKAFCPIPAPAHKSFVRLRRDISCDAITISTAYRTLHLHCRKPDKEKEELGLSGSMGYESDERSETALTRAVHLLTLGAFAWKDAKENDPAWRKRGGGSVGSLFANWADNDAAPTAKNWVSAVMLTSPKALTDNEWYEGEDNCLVLLRRLAVDGGFAGNFVAQDRAVRAGAAWLCEFAAQHNDDARKFVRASQSAVNSSSEVETGETDIQRRRRMAKEKAMERMKAQAAKFVSMMDTEFGNEDETETPKSAELSIARSENSDSAGMFESGQSSVSSATSANEDSSHHPLTPDAQQRSPEKAAAISPRLLSVRPRCIICSDDSGVEMQTRDQTEDRHRKSRKRRSDGGNALAFVGYSQASTVMKGGGPASTSEYHVEAPVRRFVGAHVALCGHAIHSECLESYLATVSNREDRTFGKRDEFRCPLCQRLSNSLVPFIDVGADWITCKPCTSESTSANSSNMKSDDQSQEDMASTKPATLNEFLNSTPWWVSRRNKNTLWDGQCAFVNRPTETEEATTESAAVVPPKLSRRKSVRPLRKKDLYAAWNAMMKTPRFVRRKLKSRGGESNALESHLGNDLATSQLFSSSESAGETVVWRRFMDQVSDITYRADGKRLGDESLHNDFGEFRHYIVEKYSYNMAKRFAGKEASDWPSCVFPSALSDIQRQELSREKLLSKLMMSIQAFTYSCCCEASEARRLVRKTTRLSGNTAGASADDNGLAPVLSKFGIDGIICDGKLVMMPKPSPSADDGAQPFTGRLGRLRYLGLAVMAATGPLAADLIQLALALPLTSSDGENAVTTAPDSPFRAPVVYPLLFGNVLTHVVVAICATNGRDRARSDSLDLIWPVPFSRDGSFLSPDNATDASESYSVMSDAEGFVKLGLLARMLQVLLGKLDMQGLDNIPGLETEFLVVKSLSKLRNSEFANFTSVEGRWKLCCITMLEMALSKHSNHEVVPEQPHVEKAIFDRLNEGCFLAAAAACSYLADVGVIMQILIPDIMSRYDSQDMSMTSDSSESDSALETFEKLRNSFQMEPVHEMLEATTIGEVLSNWYETARHHEKRAMIASDSKSGFGGKSSICSRLNRTQGFRVFDWPMEPSGHHKKSKTPLNQGENNSKKRGAHPLEPEDDGTAPMDLDEIEPMSVFASSSELQRRVALPLVTFSSKKSVALLGGYRAGFPAKANGRPRIAMIPTSYTDLYAELGRLLPDSEQTAVCLICGEVLNAGGKGECTKHSFKCGAGTGLFFLLQECAGLIMHNSKAAYIHSPYVDSHGETPQYRGRPLNLDMERYDHLREVWSGHAVRQQVLAERASSRQIIVQDYY